MTDKKERGLLGKFIVQRVDGSDQPGGKHRGCDYFVLDATHDAHAAAALRAYADSCEAEYPLLAADIRGRWLSKEQHGLHPGQEALADDHA